jgi:DNA-binding NtrC family response regulator
VRTDDRANDQPQRRTILLVEDDSFVRAATCSILQSVGFEVFPSENALEAMAIYEDLKRPIDLVMTDLVLPGKSGLQLSQELHLRWSNLVILVTSGYSNSGCDLEIPASHMFFLAKPYSKNTLVDKIEKILSPSFRARPATQAS